MQASPQFAILVPGHQLFTTFESYQDKLILTLPSPASINTISFSLIQPLPASDIAATIGFSAPPYDSISFIGAIANTRPSDTFHTGWALMPDINTKSEIKVVIEVKPLSEVADSVKIK